jgi:omega-amidase
MKIALVQTPLHWEDSAANLRMITDRIGAIRDADLIVLPEMFTTAFSMRPEKVAEQAGGPVPGMMSDWAARSGAAVTGSIAVEENGKYYNRLYFAEPGGRVHTYDKRHLFTMGDEHSHYTAGERKLIIEYRGWKICPLVCYDLRFPVWSRNRLVDGRPEYDMLLYVANWPAARSYAWRHLLVARAIENQCYVAGVNRTGVDANGYEYDGQSMFVGPKGEVVAMSGREDDTIYCEADRGQLDDFRSGFPALADGDAFRIL